MFGKKQADPIIHPSGAEASPAVPLEGNVSVPTPVTPPLSDGQRIEAASLKSNVASTGKPIIDQAASLIRYRDMNLETADYSAAKQELISELLDQVDFQALEQFTPDKKRARVAEACEKIIPKISVPLTAKQIALLSAQAIDEILGFGPIEPLLRDADVNDIMINTARHVYIEI